MGVSKEDIEKYKNELSGQKEQAKRKTVPKPERTAPPQNYNKKIKQREPSFVIAAGQKFVGKSYLTKQILRDYVHPDPRSQRPARKVLIFDVTGEWERDGGEDNTGNPIKTIYYDINEPDAWKRTKHIRNFNSLEMRRIVALTKDNKMMSPSQMLTACMDMCSNYRDGALVFEDINKYMVGSGKIEFIGALIATRHLGIDLIIHLQSLSPVTTRMWQNASYIRMHKQADPIQRYKDRLNNPELMMIAEQMIKMNYKSGNIYFHLYLDVQGDKLLNVPYDQFRKACILYLNNNPKMIRNLMGRVDFDTGGKKVFKNPKEAVDYWINERVHYIK